MRTIFVSFFYPFISISCFCCLLQTRFKLGCFVSSEQNDKNVLLVILKKMLCFSPFFLKIKWTQKVLLMIENKCLNAQSVLMFAILGHLFFSLDSQFPLLCFSFLSDQYSQAISNVFQSLLSSAIIVLNYCLSLFLFSSFFLLNSLFVISFKLKAVVRCKTVSHQKRKKRKRKTVPWLPWVLIYRK